MDPLSEVLTLLRPTHTRTAALDVAGPWSLRFPNRQGIKFCAVERGECWISAEGGQQLQHLQQGDCFLLSKAGSYVLSSEHPALPPGWMQAMTDPRIADSIRAMHGEPARTWRLDDLASIAAMSRTVYAGRFKQLMGVSPIEYLTNWRMLLAASCLRSTQQTLARIAADVGYSSEFSFIAAFTRVMDVAPGRYRRQVRTSIDAD
ncbi:TPA: helix-turn-helix transcriptional regulator [Stenotrophomonas maltophilia]|nr:helix-turn-helix transcriptional regulator [Stenotrophomonas maltophilia]HDS1156727.1 helix-turn-helix transcriptional regulator [Stenotrophomonas maltophilia]HDS1168264.1 helix-turn-helix transcriptional regulator [Stenotrophomonas maltophilia]HDS1172732.1 helix-turn-helix transcriptional regulator [Stenotrophomonas maltophilia]HDS1174847.1 helix-turn-helix transcriptional regulator [Stenotrophomonas maltophilia]